MLRLPVVQTCGGQALVHGERWRACVRLCARKVRTRKMEAEDGSDGVHRSCSHVNISDGPARQVHCGSARLCDHTNAQTTHIPHALLNHSRHPSPRGHLLLPKDPLPQRIISRGEGRQWRAGRLVGWIQPSSNAGRRSSSWGRRQRGSGRRWGRACSCAAACAAGREVGSGMCRAALHAHAGCSCCNRRAHRAGCALHGHAQATCTTMHLA